MITLPDGGTVNIVNVHNQVNKNSMITLPGGGYVDLLTSTFKIIRTL